MTEVFIKPRSNKFQDLSGMRFERLIAISYEQEGKWLCRCDCGAEKYIAGSTLRKGGTKSCGCLKKEVDRTRELTHGKFGTSEYNTYYKMLSRCNNKGDKDYRLYGARGIKVCERWSESFENFFEDMGEKPTPKHTLDRWPNNRGNYEKSNCRWATNAEQQRNRSNIIWLEINGERMTFADAAKKFKIPKGTMWGRLKRGWSDEKVVEK